MNTYRLIPLAMVAALALGACRWTAETNLMPDSVVDAPPVPPGVYADASNPTSTQTVSLSPPNGLRVRGDSSDGSDMYVWFDRLEGDYYLAEVVSNADRSYVIVRVRPRGHDVYAPSCSPDADRGLALRAGATLSDPNGDADCVFASYDSLIRAARAFQPLLLRADPANDGALHMNRR